MKKAGTGLLAIILLMVSITGAGATALPAHSYYIAFQDRLVTQVTINGRGPYYFVIDTASSRTITYEHVRAELGLKASSPDPIMVYGINQAAPAMAVQPQVLSVAGQEISGLTLGVLPDAEQRGDPDGVLGIDVLSRYFVVLDRAAMALKLLPRNSEELKNYAGWSRVPLTPRPLKNIPVDFWYLPADFNGHRMQALFDMGSGITLLNWPAAERLGVEKHKASRKFGPPPEGLRDVLGHIAPAVVVKNVTVGLPAQSWQKQEILVSNAPVFEFFDMSEKSGAIIGPGLLKDTSMAIDFAGHALYLGPTIGSPRSE